MDSGLFGPTWDVLRLAILVVGVVNVAAIVAGILVLRRYAHLLLDVEQFTREAGTTRARRLLPEPLAPSAPCPVARP